MFFSSASRRAGGRAARQEEPPSTRPMCVRFRTHDSDVESAGGVEWTRRSEAGSSQSQRGGFGALGRSWQRRSLKLRVGSTLAVLSASVDSVATEMKSSRTGVESEWRVGASLAVKASCHWKLLFEEKLTHTHARAHTHVHGHRIASSRGF